MASLDLHIRPSEPRDDPALAAVIRAVTAEIGVAAPGFAVMDAEVDAMFAAYARPGCAYFVVEREGRVVGGGGIGPLQGGEPSTCELRKMYFLAEVRGRGMGEALLACCLAAARERGYRTCYLETHTAMSAAQRLYEKFAFRRLAHPLGTTGHFGCDRWYALDLTEPARPATAGAHRNAEAPA